MEQLAKLREERGWTLKELSRISGVGADTINNLELGKRKARPSTLRKLARAFQLEPKDLFREQPSNRPSGTIQLEENEKQKLEALATRWNVSLAEAVRRLVQMVP